MPSLNKITVASRTSNLARAQVKEVLEALKKFHLNVEFDIHYLATVGDRDLLTSLRNMDKTDFFTKELDEMLLQNRCQITIHSAKDLPEPLPSGLKLICLTEGIDSSDVLVLRAGIHLHNLRAGLLIATSSARREENVNALKHGMRFVDLRGTIEQRLAKIDQGEADGVVVAEAALIRLGLTHFNRIRLPLPGAEGQGKLAILAREEDEEMAELFACLDARNLAMMRK